MQIGSRSLAAALGLATLAVSSLLAQHPSQVDDATLRKAGAGDTWITYGLDQAETRFSPLTDITPANVRDLGLSWAYEVGPGGGGQEATPLVSGGVIYGITNWSVVFAVDARTGKEKWRWDPWVNQAATRPAICCGVVNRGLALYKGLIFAPIIDGRLEALDAEIGRAHV